MASRFLAQIVLKKCYSSCKIHTQIGVQFLRLIFQFSVDADVCAYFAHICPPSKMLQMPAVSLHLFTASFLASDFWNKKPMLCWIFLEEFWSRCYFRPRLHIFRSNNMESASFSPPTPYFCREKYGVSLIYALRSIFSLIKIWSRRHSCLRLHTLRLKNMESALFSPPTPYF